ncbi:MAG: LytTR family DNA-binding domain-containing protein, partial [Bacteroidota bacterium]
KPFTDERFYAALSHAKQIIERKNTSNQQVAGFIQSQLKTGQSNQIVSESSTSERLTVKVDGKVYFVPFQEISWIEAYDYYVKIHVADRFYLLRDSLKRMETRLPSPPFVRVHKSSIINQRHLQEIAPQQNGNEYQITLINGQQLNSSRSYRDQIKTLINN